MYVCTVCVAVAEKNVEPLRNILALLASLHALYVYGNGISDNLIAGN